MSVRSAQSVTVDFETSSFTTGALANADAPPVATLVVNGVDNAATVTVTNKATGKYKAQVTLPTLAAGDIVELFVAATVGGAAGGATVWRDAFDVLLDAGGKPAVTLAAADVAGNVPADVQTIKGQAVTAAGPVTFPGTISSYAGGAVASVTGAVGSVGAAVTVGGYSAGQDPASLVLATPAQKIATDSSGRVTALDSTGAAFTYAAPPAASVIAAAVWDQATTGHTTAGTFGAEMQAAGSAGDPWATSLPGAYSAGQAGYIVGRNLDAQLSPVSARALLALPAAAPGGANGLLILGTNTAGVTLQPTAGDALILSATGGHALNAIGSAGVLFRATGLGSAALTCTPGTGGAGVASDIQGDLLGNANILYQAAVVTAATANTVTLGSPVSGPPSTTPGAYVGGVFLVKTGTGSRQVRTVTAYDAVNRVVTVDRPWDTVPDATSVGQILAGQEYAANAARAGDAMALAANAVTAASVAAGALAGKGDWATAATPMTLADGAIKEATIAAPAEAAGQPTGILGMIRRIFERKANKRTRDRSTGIVSLRNAADTANLEQSTQSTTGSVDSITKAQ